MSSSEVSLWITVTQRAGAILFAADIANTVFVDHRNLIDSDDISSDSVPQLLNASEVRGKPRSFVRSQSEGSLRPQVRGPAESTATAHFSGLSRQSTSRSLGRRSEYRIVFELTLASQFDSHDEPTRQSLRFGGASFWIR